MLGDAQTSLLALAGEAGVGKSTLAALVYHQLALAALDTNAAPFRHLAWLSLGSNASLPDCLAAILGILQGAPPADFFLLKPDQQITLLAQTLRQGSAFVALDAFEVLLQNENEPGRVGQGAVPLFLDMLQQDLGNSRVLLTCYKPPFSTQSESEGRARAFLVSRVSLPEGVALLQQRGVQGSTQELSLIWQRCGGHVYALTLFATIFSLSGFSLSFLVNSPDYQFLWNGAVTENLVSMAHNFLNPIQRTLLRALSLFSEPAPLEGIISAITGDGPAIDSLSYERELNTLTKLALIQQMPGEGRQPHYLLHTLIQRYTIEHYLEGHERRPSGSLLSTLGVAFEPNPIVGSPEAREIALAAGHTRVASYYQRLAHQLCPRAARKSLSDVEPLLAAVYHLGLGWHWQQAADLLFLEDLPESMIEWGAWNTLIRLSTALIPPAGIITRPDEALLCSHLGLLYGRLGDYRQSAYYYAQALQTQREIGDLPGQITTLINQGEILRGAGQFQQAHRNFDEAMQLLRQQQDAQLESILLHNMGLLAQDEQDYARALDFYLASLKLAQHLNDPVKQGTLLTNIGMLLFDQGRLSEALALLLPSLSIRQAAHDASATSLALFLETLEHTLGSASFAQLKQDAQGKQNAVLMELMKSAAP